jgi:hypothetical protein
MSPLNFGTARLVRSTYDNASGGWLGASGSGDTPGVTTPPEITYGGDDGGSSGGGSGGGDGSSGTNIAAAIQYGRYFVFEYQFTNGSDLDTRTGFIYPAIGAGSDNTQYEGWSRAGNEFLYWGGDNTSSSGFESCYIDKFQVLTDYPGITYIEIDTRAFWYGSYGSNGITIRTDVYAGGTMVKSGFEWTNPTATLTYPAAFSYAKNITSTRDIDGGSTNNGQRVARIKLNFANNSLSYYTT